MAVKSVTAGQSLQSAIDQSQPGDVISVEAGASFPSPIVPPNKESSTTIAVQSSRVAELPPDKQVTPADAGKMAKVIAPALSSTVADRAVNLASTAAHHYRFAGLEITHDPTRAASSIIEIGNSSLASPSQCPHTLTFDRCFIHGHPDRPSVRGVALNGRNVDILNCYISDIHEDGRDTQAICGWNGPGPFRIINTYLEAAGENVMFGGADARSIDMMPSDIEIRRCHFFKPLSWKIGHPTFAGRVWTVKNLFETKNCRRLVVEGNRFENNWTHAQAGSSIVIKCNNQDGTNPWAVTEDLLFQHNIIIGEAGLNMLLIENLPKLSAIGKRLYFRNNLWIVDRLPFQGPNSGEDIEISHNTWITKWGAVFMIYGQPAKGLKFNNNLGSRAEYGIKGDGTITSAEGRAALEGYSPGTWECAGNVIAGAPTSLYPAGNFYPAKWEDVQIGTDHRLLSISPYKGKGTDGKDPGADIDAIEAAMKAPVSQPAPSPVPSPAPAPESPSPNGTKGNRIVDSQSGVWTFDPPTGGKTLRNGIWMGGGQGFPYKYLNGEVYVGGANWFKWTGSAWLKVGLEPMPSPTPTPTPTPVPVSHPEIESVYWDWSSDLAARQSFREGKEKEGWFTVPTGSRLWGWRRKP